MATNTDEKEDVNPKFDLDSVLKTFNDTLKSLSVSLQAIPKLKANTSQSAQITKVLQNSLTELQKKAKGITTTVKAIKDGNDTTAIDSIVSDIVKAKEEQIEEDEAGPLIKQHYYAGPNHYHYLTQRGKVQAQYIWIGGSGLDMRCKTKTLPRKVTSLKDIPLWNYDGSSTGQATGNYSEVWLRPVKYVSDPFRRGNNILVLCETLNAKTRKPLPTNKRGPAMEIFGNKKVKAQKPWYGIEQEYTLFQKDGSTPLGWPKGGFPGPQGPYYCSVGAKKAFGRDVVEAHYRACLYARINISGINAEVMPGQWEYQIGPCEGVDSGDSLWLSRYLLERVAEEFNIVVSFDVKPVPGDWNGAGCHTNYSTESMRNKKGGMDAILDGIKKMKCRHATHMKVYGKGNKRRLTGKHETQKFDEFSYGVADRGASIRIPRQCEIDKCGYFEDRRPGANMDPYEVTSLIAETTILYDPKDDE